MYNIYYQLTVCAFTPTSTPLAPLPLSCHHSSFRYMDCTYSSLVECKLNLMRLSLSLIKRIVPMPGSCWVVMRRPEVSYGFWPVVRHHLLFPLPPVHLLPARHHTQLFTIARAYIYHYLLYIEATEKQKVQNK
jgi:hypothetical protein